MVAFPKIGYCFKLKSDACTNAFGSHRMIVSKIIESGERITKEQVLRFYNLCSNELSDNTRIRLAVFARPRVVFWDFTNGRYRIYPWDEQTAKRIWERLVPVGVYDVANNTVIPTVEVNPEDKAAYNKAAKTYEVRKDQLKVGELWMMDCGSSTGKSLDPVPAVSWSEHAKVVTELSALKATLRKHFPSLKFD